MRDDTVDVADGRLPMGGDLEKAVLAGGCAWIMQQLLRQREGVVSTRIGWTGGTGDNPTEDNDGGHAEAVEVTFDSQRLSYRDLLEFFFLVHRPDLDADVVGSIYRSEIFCVTAEQQRTAEQMIQDVDASKHWLGKTVTRVTTLGTFWEMETDDQDYLQRFPNGCKPPFPQQAQQVADTHLV